MNKTTLGLILIIMKIGMIMGKTSDQIRAMNNFTFKLHTKFFEEHPNTGMENLMYFPICPWDPLLQSSKIFSVLNGTGLKLFDVENLLMTESLELYEWKSDVFLDQEKLGISMSLVSYGDIRKNLEDRWYHGKIENFQFVDLKNISFMSSSINDRFKRKFNINKNIIKSDELTEETQGVIVSWMSFHNNWKYPFASDSRTTEVFNFPNRKATSIPMMGSIEMYKWGHLEFLPARFIVLPFKDEDFNMIMIVPYQGVELGDIERKIMDIDLSKILSKQPELIKLYLPKFQIKTTYNFYRSEFLGKTMHIRSIKYTKIIHKTFMDSSVFESRTRFPGEVLTRKAMEFIVDQPFLVLIAKKYRENNIILFYARVNDPIE